MSLSQEGFQSRQRIVRRYRSCRAGGSRRSSAPVLVGKSRENDVGNCSDSHFDIARPQFGKARPVFPPSSPERQKKYFLFFWTHFSVLGIGWPVHRTLVIQGRSIRPEDVALIRDWLQAHPDSNRTRLSRDLCAAWNWRNGAGRLKDMACRSLLLNLEAQGEIRLPPRWTASVNGSANRHDFQIEHDPSSIEGPLSVVQPLRV